MTDPTHLSIRTFLSTYARCPDCKAFPMAFTSDAVRCPECNSSFPVVDGAPALMNADNEVFPRDAYAKAAHPSKRGASLSAYFPWKSVNLSAKAMVGRVVEEVASATPGYVLVI